MKNCDFTLELADGTIVRVGSLANSRHPDVKAFYFPAGTLTPFSHKNLPTTRGKDERSDSGFTGTL